MSEYPIATMCIFIFLGISFFLTQPLLCLAVFVIGTLGYEIYVTDEKAYKFVLGFVLFYGLYLWQDASKKVDSTKKDWVEND